jgi:hypothetical protein
MTIKVGDMVAFVYRNPETKSSTTIVALVARWNGNLDAPGLLVSTTLERYWRPIDAATFFSAWTGLYIVGAPAESGQVVLTVEHARVCRRSIEEHLATKDGAELLNARIKKHDVLDVPSEGRGHLEVYEIPVQPFPAAALGCSKSSDGMTQMDTYIDRGVGRRKFLEHWQERQPRVYDEFLRGSHHRDARCVGLIDPSTIRAA